MNGTKKMKFKRANEMRNISELTQEELDIINQVKMDDVIISNELGYEEKKEEENEKNKLEVK